MRRFHQRQLKAYRKYLSTARLFICFQFHSNRNDTAGKKNRVQNRLKMDRAGKGRKVKIITHQVRRCEPKLKSDVVAYSFAFAPPTRDGENPAEHFLLLRACVSSDGRA
jgi:hypothetical protein